MKKRHIEDIDYELEWISELMNYFMNKYKELEVERTKALRDVVDRVEVK